LNRDNEKVLPFYDLQPITLILSKKKMKEKRSVLYTGVNLNWIPKEIRPEILTFFYKEFNSIIEKEYKLIKNNKYDTIKNKFFEDSFDNYLDFLIPRLKEAYRILKPNGTMYLHLDYREIHYAKIEMDKIFGRNNFLGEIIWAFDFGAISRKKWTMKHNNILYYVKNKDNYTFNFDKIPRVPYLAPGLAGFDKAAIGKIVKSVWFETIVGTNSKEKCNYATQKPLRILNRIVEVSSNPGDLCMDFFAGSGSFGEACKNLGREFILIDSNPEAIGIMKKRLNL
jgi:site-specific DNA-methyltransferase (adenine-specific)